MVPVVKYLLEKGADATRSCRGLTAEALAKDSFHEVHKLLVGHRQAKEAEQAEQEGAIKGAADALFTAKGKKADEVAQALLVELDAEEAESINKKKIKKKKRNKDGKKKGSGSEQGPLHGKKIQGGQDKGDEENTNQGKEEENEQGRGGGDQKEGGGDAAISDTTTTFQGMMLLEREGQDQDEGELSTISKGQAPAEGDWSDDAPDEYICPLEGRLLTEAPVLASDGFVYSKMGLERWISHCATKGLPLTSPKTEEGVDAAFMLNMTYRTLVRDWVEGCKASAEK